MFLIPVRCLKATLTTGFLNNAPPFPPPRVFFFFVYVGRFQLAYAELFFLEKHWPEVEHDDLLEVVKQFQGRQRRFGK